MMEYGTVLEGCPVTHHLLAKPLSHKCAPVGMSWCQMWTTLGQVGSPAALPFPSATWLSCWIGICHSALVVEGSALLGGTSPSVKEDAAFYPETRVLE